jgi:hypothetical protein
MPYTRLISNPAITFGLSAHRSLKKSEGFTIFHGVTQGHQGASAQPESHRLLGS